MTYLYSLYDALVSIDVPADKARAVVDAMERDMGSTLATKQELRQEVQLVRHEIQLVKQELLQEVQLLKQEIVGLERGLNQKIETGFKLADQKREALRSEMSRDLAAERQSIIVQLGSVIVACFGLTLAAMRFWI